MISQFLHAITFIALSFVIVKIALWMISFEGKNLYDLNLFETYFDKEKRKYKTHFNLKKIFSPKGLLLILIYLIVFILFLLILPGDQI